MGESRVTLMDVCTDQNMQGLTLTEIVVRFELVNQRIVDYGQVYVALIRVATLTGLHIVRLFNVNTLRANP